MVGEFNINKFGAFLKSFWGLLASFTVVLPSLIYILNADLVKDSILSDYYLGIPTTFALLVIPFSFLFEKELSILQIARRSSILFAVTALLSLFSFLTIKGVYVANRTYKLTGEHGYGYIQVDESKNGQVMFTTYGSYGDDEPKKKEERVNKLELACVALYSVSIMLLTASFSTLGVFFYSRNVSEIQGR